MNCFGNVFRKTLCKLLFIFVFFLSLPAGADAPSSVMDMLKKAAEQDNAENFQVVLTLALETWPKDREEILTMAEEVKASWMVATQTDEIKVIRKERAAQEAASRARGIIHYLDPKLWNGKAQLGAGSSTGDTDEKSVALGLSFDRKFGDNWEHELDFAFDFARSSGLTTRQRFVGKYELLWRAWDKGFLLNYTELEVDRFSGYDYRVVENIGLGFDMFETKRHELRLEGGPGVRFSKLDDLDMIETEYLGRVSSTYKLKLSDRVELKDKASVIFASESTTVENLTQFSAKINSQLAARVAFEVKYDSAAPIDTAAWDTATRATLVYGF